MATAVQFEQFTTDVAEGVHDNFLTADTDVLKLALSNTAPTKATDGVFGDITEIGAGNGYTAGGEDVANAATETGGVITVTATDIVWSASGGTIGPFQYAVLYNDTPSSPVDPLIAYWDYGSALTLQIGESFTANFGAYLLKLNA